MNIPNIIEPYLLNRRKTFYLAITLPLTAPIVFTIDEFMNHSHYEPNPINDSPAAIMMAIWSLPFVLLPFILILTYLCQLHLKPKAKSVKLINFSLLWHPLAILLLTLLCVPCILTIFGNIIGMVPREVSFHISGGEKVTITTFWFPTFFREIWIGLWLFFSSILAVSLVSRN